MDIINPNSLNILEDVRGTFIVWSNEMDKIYIEADRKDGASWNRGSPADWMRPYNQELFDAWLEYDAHSPTWEEKARDAVHEVSLLEATQNNDKEQLEKLNKRVSEGKTIRIM